MNRTMVKVRCVENDGIEFKTYSRAKGGSSGFFVLRDTFEELERSGSVIRSDSGCYAVFRRNDADRTVSISFDWLTRSGDRLFGRKETVALDYEMLMEFVRISAEEGGPRVWRYLSLPPRRKLPQLVFRCRGRLRECVGNKLVRRKLVKFLRDNFKWPHTERIEFYSDFVPYSFFFREFRGDTPVMCGGLILHGQEDMAKAYYSIHT